MNNRLNKDDKKTPIKLITKSVIAFFVILWTLIAGLPYFYMIITSLKKQSEFLSGGSFSLPKTATIENYILVLKGTFFNYLKNSLLVVGVSLALLLIISAAAAYPLSRMKFKLNKPIYAIIVASMAIPIHITLVPVFSMAMKFGLYDSIWALVGPYVAFNLPVSVFILTSFMQGIPKEIEEAAEMDGCNKYSIFFRMILPLSKAGIATLAIYNGVAMWNEFSFAMVLTQSQVNRTLPLAVWEYQGQYSMNIPMVMSVLALSSVPIILLYILGQDKLIKGMMAGAVKG